MLQALDSLKVGEIDFGVAVLQLSKMGGGDVITFLEDVNQPLTWNRSRFGSPSGGQVRLAAHSFSHFYRISHN